MVTAMVLSSLVPKVAKAWGVFGACVVVFGCGVPILGCITSPILPNWLTIAMVYRPREMISPDGLVPTNRDTGTWIYLTDYRPVLLASWLTIGLVFGVAARNRSIRWQIALAFATIAALG